MFVYWLLFGYFAVGTMSGSRPFADPRLRPAMLLGALLLIVLIGLRFEVGADWLAYERLFSYASLASFSETIERGDPAYQAVNWSVAAVGADFWLVNVVCAAIFVWGLVRLANVQPSPFLAIAVAVPYLVIVVSMGYTRQAAAIGLVMAGLATLDKGRSAFRFALYVTLAALFHKTAVVVLPLVIFSGRHNKALNVIAGLALTYWLYSLLLADTMDQFAKNYLERGYNSQGAAIRVIMNLVPAVLFFLARKKLMFNLDQAVVWRSFSIAAFAMLIALLVSPSSTAIDRVALYIIPLQVVVVSRAFLLLENPNQGKLVVVAYAALIQFTWLNFATHSQYWVPYHFYPFGR